MDENEKTESQADSVRAVETDLVSAAETDSVRAVETETESVRAAKSESVIAAETQKSKKTIMEFLKFFAFSCGAGILQLIVCTVLNEALHIHYWLSYVIALVLSVVYNFTINRKFTFKSVVNLPKAMALVLGYYVVFTPLSAFWGALLTDGMFFQIPVVDGLGWNMFLVLIPTMAINMITEFLYWKYFVFRFSGTPKKHENNNVANKNEDA